MLGKVSVPGPAQARMRPMCRDEPEWLGAWQRRHRYTDRAAAEVLGLSVSAFRRQRASARSSRQTELLVDYVTIHRTNWLEIAEIATKLARKYAENVMDRCLANGF